MHTCSDEEASSSSESDAAQNQRGLRGVTIFTIFLCLVGTGIRNMTYAIIGTALPDLLQLTNSTTSDAGKVLAPHALGFVLGVMPVRYCLGHGKALVATLAMLTLAVATVLVPVSSSFLFMTVMATVQGVASGIGSVTLLAIFIELCDEKYREQSVQADYAFKASGPIFGPLLIRPFLSKELIVEDGGNSTSALNNTFDVTDCWGNCSQQSSKRWTESHLFYGYAIISIICFLVSVGFFVVYILEKCTSMNNKDIAPSPTGSRKLKEIFSSRRVIAMTVMIFISNTCLCGALKLYVDFMTTFCIDPTVGFPKAEAVLMMTVFFCGVCFGRFNVACWISKLLTSYQIIFIGLVGLGVMFFVLCFWADKSKILLWVSSVYFGLLYAPLLPSLLSLSLEYIAEDPLMMSLSSGGDMVGALIFPTIVPPMFVTVGPMVLMYAMFGCIMVSLTFTISLYPLMRHSPQYNQLKDTELVAILDKSKSAK